MLKQTAKLKKHRVVGISLVLVLFGFSLSACSSIYTLTPDNPRSLERCMKALGWTTEGPEGTKAYGKTYYKLGATHAAYKRNYLVCAASPVDHLPDYYSDYYYPQELSDHYSGDYYLGDRGRTDSPRSKERSTPAKSSHPRNRSRPR